MRAISCSLKFWHCKGNIYFRDGKQKRRKKFGVRKKSNISSGVYRAIAPIFSGLYTCIFGKIR